MYTLEVILLCDDCQELATLFIERGQPMTLVDPVDLRHEIVAALNRAAAERWLFTPHSACYCPKCAPKQKEYAPPPPGAPC